ncbi:PA0069 family radical SAM protein [Zavarzinia compransoris]|uniref:Radical SAM protein n=1 Tax=Zavarzinia compransoris TaxID=1264899 RepID=A0A317ECM6_9PROT|nr:PA0069 family radical SAM protein [Zavarzinia compransoris]PWR24026.1 radical SAM protein [Zavarzinia compransoris]TDP48286.1 DNA repair photolyase [Zavarzinia compransoris]
MASPPTIPAKRPPSPRPVFVRGEAAEAPRGRRDGKATADKDAGAGRGTLSNASGRFETQRRVALDDGWGNLDEPAPRLHTTVQPDKAQSVISRNDSPDLGFDRSINAYRGCEHGCTYCYARPTHAWLGLSPGLDFESRLFFKPDAARLLEAELGVKSYRCKPIAMGTNTDPYQPIDKKLEITRAILDVLERWNHPVTIVTKSALVQRDIDILGRMAQRNLARVALSVTTLDRRLARRMEPRAATPERRLEAIRALAGAGIPTGVITAPIIPGLTDHETEAILDAGAKAGAGFASYVLLRLPLEIKDLFQEWLAAALPERAPRVLALVRDIRDGQLNSAEFGTRQHGQGAYAEMIAQRFRLACTRLGLDTRRHALDVTRFRPPLDRGGQMALFGD